MADLDFVDRELEIVVVAIVAVQTATKLFVGYI